MLNQVPLKRESFRGGVQMHIPRKFLLYVVYVAGIFPLGKLQTVGMCIWNMQKHIAMSKQYLKN